MIEDEYRTVASSSTTPELTVLMPIFRQEDFVADAIRSVLDQDDIVLDVIISDDASGDDTYARAMDAVRAKPAHRHNVRMRNGSERLGRAHIHYLARVAHTPIVAQAHGDDIALPGRFRQIADVIVKHKAAFVTSGFTSIDAEDTVTENWDGEGGVRSFSLAEAIERPNWSMGAMEAWTPDAFEPFAALDLDFAPVSHDRILAVRAAMLGRGWLIDAPLIHRRSHASAWNRRLVDGGSPEARRHGWALVALMWAGVVLDDVRAATQAKLLDPADIPSELKRVRNIRDSALRGLRRHHGSQLMKGKRLKWVGDS